MQADTTISIGQLASRTGVSVAALRYYETLGLISAERNSGRQRRFTRADIRRVSFLLIAQRLGQSLEEIGALLARLPDGRAPNAADWAVISRGLKERLEGEIIRLQATRDTLDGCIGCGCLSLAHCALYNPADQAARHGAGPRYTMGDRAPVRAEKSAR
jgi:MerR family transcriptional regulator, redox-sensitive transcriptional activator SoxR